MFHKIKCVEPENDFVLKVTFTNMEKREYDLKPLIENVPMYAPLKEDINEYAKVQVDSGGYGISWSDSIDLSAEEIWNNGERRL